MVQRSFSRAERIGDLIQKTLGSIFLSESRDPRLSDVSISRVELQSDLKKAHIYYTLIDPTDEKEITKVLNKASGFFRQRLAQSTELKYTPILKFAYDQSILYASNLTKIIDEAE
jgi:ribosome-binding factor A